MPPAVVFSIVVPTYARPGHLDRCLRSLGALNYPRDAYEVIVVDDGHAPETSVRVAEAQKTFGFSATSLAQMRQGPATARNAGARAARGRFVAFTDDDCTPHPDWLIELERVLSGGQQRLVGGTTVNGLPDLICSTASQMLVDYLYTYYDTNRSGSRFFTTNNIAVTTESFRQTTGFDETFPLAGGEDRDFCERWLRLGGDLVHADRARVEHWHGLTFRRFVRQHFNYGRGAFFLHSSRLRRDPVARPGLPKREPSHFYTGMMRYPFTRVGAAQAVPLALLIALSQVVYVAGYLFQRQRRNRDKSA